MSWLNIEKILYVLMWCNYFCNTSSADSKNFSQPHVRIGGWTPIPTKHSKLLSEKIISHLASESSPVSSHVNKKHQRIDMLPIPVIKPHPHGATLGFDLPEQGLTLYLDIDELATKPLAQNIGLKVVSHDRQQASSSVHPAPAPPPAPQHAQNVHHQKSPPSNNYYQFNPKNPRVAPTVKPTPVPQMPKRQKSRFIGSYEGNVPSSNQQSFNSPSANINANNNKKLHIGFVRPKDLQKALKHVGHQMSNYGPSGRDNKPQMNIDYAQTPTKGRPPPPVSRPVPRPMTPSKTSPPRPPSRPKVPKPKVPKVPDMEEQRPMQLPEDDDNEVTIISTTPSTEFEDEKDVQQHVEEEDNFQPADKAQIPEPQKHIDKEESDIEDKDNGDDKTNAIMSPLSTPTTNAHFGSHDDINTIVRPFSNGRECPAIQSCQLICAPNNNRITTDSTNIKLIATELNSDAILNTFPSLEETLQNILDLSGSSYTLFLPSNDAISRLPQNLINQWTENPENLNNVLDNHLLETAQTLEDMRISQIIQPRSAGASIRVNNYRNDSYTVNGQRIAMADQTGPGGGMVHVIDGILFPTADKDIMDTLKTCNRFDGFITLAEGTGFSDMLKQSGPFTVFVPSNEALQKVPDSDLDIIRKNMTALREFLKYHVAKGSYYSNDLKDGQFIPSLIDNQPIQVGIRVDGCSRRLVEANVSPLYRADIPASNGVIHVVDWVLKQNDRDWCENVILPR